ncbi:heavy metal-associated isoprenylated plant protein 23 [Brachypodium distachyon]|uniref:HMA domain-containing protein n=1 Tax=Brachypodium distachyon TaxID=15368 RepID=I1IF69_BRADI|nr:heavy metal-associated isoprenylated plant protein 23 [Brachypodium distachyon]PNT69627.1 hypothetical protein BRADI_3g59080v3 [Brachypodium distachyon]|eukprot:XP_003573094.3 heavy metal-associated isoprenylated plant protein 23 [Brachypodium distachyon]
MGGSVKRLVLGLLGAVGGGGGHGGKKRTRRRHQHQQQLQLQLQLQTVVVELRVRMDCERCERQVKKALAGITGVEHVEVSRRQQRVTVTGNVDPHKVLRQAQLTGKKAELWRTQNNPAYSSTADMALYGMGAAAQAHERWAAAVPYQRNPDATTLSAEHITDLFSDDNPNACFIM